jgi:predicted HTH domain antitoxin
MVSTKMHTFTINYSDDVLLSLKETTVEFEHEAKFLLALKLYELGKLSSGKAATLAGISRVSFLGKLGAYKVSPFQVSINDVLAEIDED